jgi:nitroimidazol reductase NimA-like FMN-containing flavoprotein (pyridoxamine 5'-phosphate oxidase superfamily)
MRIEPWGRRCTRRYRRLLDEHRIMTLATLRPDGRPQATTLGSVSDGLTLYFMCGRDSQKARNLARARPASWTRRASARP